MKNHRTSPTRSPLVALLAVLMLVTLAACGDGTDQADLDALRGRMEIVEERVETAMTMIADVREEVEGNAEAMAAGAQEELDEAQAVLDEVLEELAPPPEPAADPAAVPADPAMPPATDPPPAP